MDTSNDPTVGTGEEKWGLILQKKDTSNDPTVGTGEEVFALTDCCCPYNPYPYPYEPYDPYQGSSMTLMNSMFSEDNVSQLYVPLPFLADLVLEPTINSRENILLDEELDLDETSRYQILGDSAWI